MDEARLELNRRRFLECVPAAGAFALLPGALAAVAQDAPRVTLEMLDAAQKIAGISFTPAEQDAILARLNSNAGPMPGFAVLRGASLESTQSAIVFNPVVPGMRLPTERRPLVRRPLRDVAMPGT